MILTRSGAPTRSGRIEPAGCTAGPRIQARSRSDEQPQHGGYQPNAESRSRTGAEWRLASMSAAIAPNHCRDTSATVIEGQHHPHSLKNLCASARTSRGRHPGQESRGRARARITPYYCCYCSAVCDVDLAWSQVAAGAEKGCLERLGSSRVPEHEALIVRVVHSVCRLSNWRFALRLRPLVDHHNAIILHMS